MIAIVYPQFYGVGGIARYLDSFLSNLPSDHSKVYLITGDKNRRLARYKGVEIINVPFTSNRLSLLLWSLRVRKILIQLHNQKKIQWVNLHIPPLIPGLLLPKKIPMVLTTHNTYLGMTGDFHKEQYFKGPWSAVSVNIKRRMESYIFNQSKKMIVLSEQGKQEALAYGYKNQISTIPIGIDVDKFKPKADLAKDIDVLFCGRMEHRKGSRAMVELCKALIIKKPGIAICIVGYGSDESWVRSHLDAFTSSNVEFAGETSFIETIDFYQRSRVHTSTAYYEGFPNTCLEAMAMEVPVVVWDFLVYRNLVINGETGLLIAINDFDEMATQITSLLADQNKMLALGKQARKIIESNYRWNKLAQDILTASQG